MQWLTWLKALLRDPCPEQYAGLACGWRGGHAARVRHTGIKGVLGFDCKPYDGIAKVRFCSSGS